MIILYGVIYQAINKVNGHSYIGLTKNGLKLRKRGHYYAAFTANSDLYFHRALRKYGDESFEWIVIDRADSLEELNRLEMEYIEHFGTYGDNGYNLTNGGDGQSGVEIPRISRERMARAKGGRPFLVFDLHGNYVSTEVIQSEFASDNDILVPNVCSVLRGRKNSIGGFILFYEDAFSISKLRAKLRRVINVREFDVHCKTTNRLVGTWTNQTHCAKELGIQRKSIANCLKGVQQTTKDYEISYVS